MNALLSIEKLSLRIDDGRALISDLSFDIAPGERLGLIGESGSGKSLTAMAVMGLLPANMRSSGSILLDGRQVVGAAERDMIGLRGAVAAVVFQEPLTALNPLMRIGRQVAGPLRRRLVREGKSPSRAELQSQIVEMLSEVALPQPERIAHAYPHQMSGGQRQRAAIAMALACRPKLLIADEPTTALDVTTQAEILALLDKLVRERGMSLMFISHDLPVVASIADRVVVLRDGKALEQGALRDVFGTPGDPYTASLLDAARGFDRALEGRP